MFGSHNIMDLDYNFIKDKKQRCLEYIKIINPPNTFTCNDYKVLIQFKNKNNLVECVSIALK